MKSLLGQPQNQNRLDDLLGSSRGSVGKNLPGTHKNAPAGQKNSANEESFGSFLRNALIAPKNNSLVESKSNNNKIDHSQSLKDMKSSTPKASPTRNTTAAATSNPTRKLTPDRSDKPDVADFSNEKQDVSSPKLPEKLEKKSSPKNSLEGSRQVWESKDESEQTEKPASLKDSRSTLAPLKQVLKSAQSQESLIGRNAVLAFVTGHLEKLDPNNLSAIVSDSALIQQALASGDISDFMSRSMSISDLSNLFELDQGILNKASQGGLDPSNLVLVKDFVNALGIDSGKVTSELSLLLQKLPVEGLQSYIDRAKALAARGQQTSGIDPLIQQNPGKFVTETGVPGRPTNPTTIMTPMPNISGEALANQTTELSTAGTAAEPQPFGAISEPNGAQASFRSSQSVFSPKNPVDADPLNRNPLEILKSLTEDPSSIQRGFDLESDGFSIDVSRDLENSDGNLDALDLQQLSLVAPMSTSYPSGRTAPNHVNNPSVGGLKARNVGSVSDVKPSLSQVNISSEIDPFQTLGAEMNKNDLVSFEFSGDGISSRTLEENLLGSGLRPHSEIQMENASKIESNIVKGTDIPPMYESIISPSLDQGNKTSTNTDLNRSNLPELVTDVANFDGNTVRGLGDKGREFFDGKRDDQGDRNSEPFDGDQYSLSLGGPKGSLFEISGSDVQLSSEKSSGNPPKAGIASKLLSQAEVMLKNGGGSMRVDMEAPGIGRIDVAINLNNNQLDVRIITASEHARDMISNEITGLRDGLNQQGITLRGLEISKTGSSGSETFGNSQHSFGQSQNGQRPSYNDMKDYVQSFRSSYPNEIARPLTTVTPNLAALSKSYQSGLGRVAIRI